MAAAVDPGVKALGLGTAEDEVCVTGAAAEEAAAEEEAATAVEEVVSAAVVQSREALEATWRHCE